GLGIPTIWVPHSYRGCSQHAPNEHLPLSIAREALGIMAGVFWGFGGGGGPGRNPVWGQKQKGGGGGGPPPPPPPPPANDAYREAGYRSGRHRHRHCPVYGRAATMVARHASQFSPCWRCRWGGARYPRRGGCSKQHLESRTTGTEKDASPYWDGSIRAWVFGLRCLVFMARERDQRAGDCPIGGIGMDGKAGQ